jgi:hypothetical protein
VASLSGSDKRVGSVYLILNAQILRAVICSRTSINLIRIRLQNSKHSPATYYMIYHSTLSTAEDDECTSSCARTKVH